MVTVNEINVKTKRIYQEYSPEDGYRVLIDRLWPRGVSKEKAQLDEWLKEVAPSNELRKWFGHESEKFVEFSHRYKAELADKEEIIEHICKLAREQKVTLLYAAKNTQHNHALVLEEFLRAFCKG